MNFQVLQVVFAQLSAALLEEAAVIWKYHCSAKERVIHVKKHLGSCNFHMNAVMQVLQQDIVL